MKAEAASAVRVVAEQWAEGGTRQDDLLLSDGAHFLWVWGA
jgi:hypothetical protein